MDGFSPPILPAPNRNDSLFRRYGEWLRDKLRLRYGDAGEDLTHEAFLRLVAKAGEVQHHKAFLLTVADNLARDQFRKDQRQRARAHDVEAFTSTSTAAPQEQALLIKQIVLALPQELRDVLILSLIQGLTYREIAALRGIPERTVKDRMRRAMARASAALRD